MRGYWIWTEVGEEIWRTRSGSGASENGRGGSGAGRIDAAAGRVGAGVRAEGEAHAVAREPAIGGVGERADEWPGGPVAEPGVADGGVGEAEDGEAADARAVGREAVNAAQKNVE